MVKISFGTDGWRGVMGKDFTFDNVKIVAQGITDYVQSHGLRERGVIVGI
jgi:phosphomannomutase